MSGYWGKDGQKSDKYEILPPEIFSSGVIALLYMYYWKEILLLTASKVNTQFL